MQKFTGIEYIMIDIANQYGLDKLTWDKRIQFVKDNITQLDTLQNSAEYPVLFAKAVRVYHMAMAGYPTGFIMGLDATASGIQIMACLQGCKKTAEAVNLIDTGKREDVYATVATEMSNITGETLTKAEVKKPVMTTFYGSKQQPEQTFGADSPALAAFYETLGNMLPGAMECMEDMQGCWQPDALEHKWTMPDGHVVKVKVKVAVDKKIEVDELDHATFTHRAYVNKPQEQGLSLAANIVHSIDGYIVREMIRRANQQGFECITIHDSFWASPNHMNSVRQNYLDILKEIADSDLLEHILNEITGSDGVLTKKSYDLSTAMANADYALS